MSVAMWPLSALLLGLVLPGVARARYAFTHFESGVVRPLALSPDGHRLFVVNTPDGRLEILRVGSGGIARDSSVAVGLEPVAVAVRSDTEVWVVNHLSDSVSIVDVGSTPPRVVRTLHVGDEPRDIVFAGPLVGGARSRAFITTAHRGQNAAQASDLTTPGLGRADVYAFDANALGPSLGGTPIAVVTLFADSTRALAVSPDGAMVYAAAFLSSNRTTIVGERLVCDDTDLTDGLSASPCTIVGVDLPGGLPLPERNHAGVARPETGLIVRYDGLHWRDESGRIWDDAVRLSLPDEDVFRIDAGASPPTLVPGGVWNGVGTVLYGLAVNPVSGKVYVSNTEANNEVRFEGSGVFGALFGASTVQGAFAKARITVLDGTNVALRPLNGHIDYEQRPAPPGVKERSIATPIGMAVSSDGETLYVAGFGSDAISIVGTAALEAGLFVPSASDQIAVSGGGPAGVVLDEARGRLYVATRFDDGVSVIDLASRSEILHTMLPSPEPPSVVDGRRILYDARGTSSNGEASCAGCHVFGDLDGLAWDLGDPDADVVANPIPSRLASARPFHPMKGPMTTQSLRGMAVAGSMHWRGDRTGGNAVGGSWQDENAAFLEFAPAFIGLNGAASPLASSDLQRFADFALELTYPPNPIRALDGSLTPLQAEGRDAFLNQTTGFFISGTCSSCHPLDPARGLFGADGAGARISQAPQSFKNPHLRNLYQKIGMFGLLESPSTGFPGASDNLGDQVRGFGFLHDGSIDTLQRFVLLGNLNLAVTQLQRVSLEQFLLAFDTNLAPAVGQQVTLDAANAAVAGPRIDLLLARAQTPFAMADVGGATVSGAHECELVARAALGGRERGWWLADDGAFHPDDGGPPVSDASLRAAASVPDQAVTYTCHPPSNRVGIPPGDTGRRLGIDRDEDGILDASDRCWAHFDPVQGDGDGDGVGDACDICPALADADQSDVDADGVGDACDDRCVGAVTFLAGVSPQTGAPGAIVELLGTGFGPALEVQFGNTPAAVIRGGANVFARVPLLGAGSIQAVGVRNPEGCRAPQTSAFTVTAPVRACGLQGGEAIAVLGILRLQRRILRSRRARDLQTDVVGRRGRVS